MNGYKKWFFRGLAALLPTLVTLVILVKLVTFINNDFGKYIGNGITQAVGWAWPELQVPKPAEVEEYLKARDITPSRYEKEAYDKEVLKASWDIREQRLKQLGQSWIMVLVGFILALLLVTFLGLFLASIIGRKLWQVLEEAISRIPIVRQIYPYIKQFTDYIFGEKKMAFSRVVAVPYPSKGIWQVGFVTGPALPGLQGPVVGGKELITVFVPTSPTPFTGFVANIPKEDIVDLPMTLDQAFRFIVSGGVLGPNMAPGTEAKAGSGDPVRLPEAASRV